MLAAVTIVAALLVAEPSITQMPIPCPQAHGEDRAPAESAKTKKRKLTKDEERAQQLLAGVEAEADAAEPAMQAYLYMRLANLWLACGGNHDAIDAMSVKALQSSKTVEDTQGLQTSLQTSIVRRFSVNFLLQHVDELGETAREQVLPQLAWKLARAKRYEEAVALFDRLGDAKTFPFAAAGAVLKALPEGWGLERRKIFTLAMQAARGNTENAQSSIYDFGSLVVDSWQYLPESQVNDAIDLLLNAAREETPGISMAFTTGKGEISFRNSYEYRLFQLLPVLRKVNPSKAEELTNAYPGVRLAFQQYPDGLASLRADGPLSMTMSTGDVSEPEAFERVEAFQRRVVVLQQQRKYREALNEIAAANDLSTSTRVMLLLNIAESATEYDKDIAADTLKAVDVELGKLPRRTFTSEAIRACRVWMKLEKPERCDDLLAKAAKHLEELIAEDSGKDPTFKGYRTSLFDMEGLTYYTCRRDPKRVDAVVSGLRDPELKTIVRLTQARCLLELEREFWNTYMLRSPEEKLGSF